MVLQMGYVGTSNSLRITMAIYIEYNKDRLGGKVEKNNDKINMKKRF